MADTTATATPTLKSLADAGSVLMMLQNGKMSELALTVLQQSLAGTLSTDVLGASDSLKLFGQVDSFDALRKLQPSAEGVRVSLRGWNSGSRFGNGEFVGHVGSTATDDGGTVASSGQKWYWTRVIDDPRKLDVTAFGALPDGKTDCAKAVLAMFKWAQAKYPQIGIQFPAGTFYLSQLSLPDQIAYFRLAGQHANFGYFAATTLVSNTDSNYLLDLKTRWTEISGIIFDGGNKTVKNTKGFYNNNIIEGQFINVHCVIWRYVGGTCMQMKDTLDTKISQWYASNCSGDVLAAGFSNSPNGNWDHSTAIELSNFNVQSCNGGQVFNLPRATQSFLTNGWIEHSDNPGDMTNGQWTITGFSMEGCAKPMRGHYSRLINMQQNLQSGSSWDFNENPTDGTTRWLSVWERGRVEIQNHGVYVDGTLDVMAVGSRNKLNNNTANAQWFKVGDFYSPQTGDSIDINLVGCGNNLTIGNQLSKLDDVRQGGGNTLVRVHLTKAGAQASHMPCGSSPLQGVRCAASGNNNFSLYVQLKPYTYNVVPLVTMTGRTHFESGVSVYWIPDVKTMSDADMSGVTGSVDSKENWSMGQKAGVGASDDGYLLLKSKVVNGTIQVMVEGTVYGLTLNKV